MARSAQSASLSAVPGFRPGVVSSVFAPQAPALPQLPQVPAIDDARAPNAVSRSILANQLAPLAQQNQANLTGIQAQAKLGLAGYGGWKFGEDDPNTVTREDLNLSFDQNAGPGEREKQAIRDTRAQFAKQGALYSSQANQNIASAVQRLSLEAQQVAMQYSNTLNQEYTGYANQVANVVGQWASLYGQDTAWLMQNPPPAPPPVAAPAPALAPAPAPAPAQPKLRYTAYGYDIPGANPKPKRKPKYTAYGYKIPGTR